MPTIRAENAEKSPQKRPVNAEEISKCQYRLKIPHSADRKIPHPPEKMVYSFSRLVENGTGW